jgi:Apea-like HEPN
VRVVSTAAKFYMLALQAVERQPEVAYLNLITAGEILAGHFEYDKDELLDDDTQALLQRIDHGMPDGSSITRQLKGRLFQTKRRFVRTLTSLMTRHFFEHSESAFEECAFKQDSFAKRIAGAYDLRSKYVHTGRAFGHLIDIERDQALDFQRLIPDAGDAELKGILARAPTYVGLERTIRFALLRFIHINCFEVDERLNGDA